MGDGERGRRSFPDKMLRKTGGAGGETVESAAPGGFGEAFEIGIGLGVSDDHVGDRLKYAHLRLGCLGTRSHGFQRQESGLEIRVGGDETGDVILLHR